MNRLSTRRQAIGTLVMGLGTLAALRTAAATTSATTKPAPAASPASGDKPHLQPTDPTAVALSYFEDASKVDATKFPTYKPGQLCDNCLQQTGNAGEAWRSCTLFPGKLVSDKGWCKVYVKKP